MGDFDKADLDEVCLWMHDVLGYGVDPADFPEKWKVSSCLFFVVRPHNPPPL